MPSSSFVHPTALIHKTIGDSYVAVVGLPERCDDHAAVMAKFARDCRGKFHELCGKLETFLGPETAELGIRIGLHSGPVTAGMSNRNSLSFLGHYCPVPPTFAFSLHSLSLPLKSTKACFVVKNRVSNCLVIRVREASFFPSRFLPHSSLTRFSLLL